MPGMGHELSCRTQQGTGGLDVQKREKINAQNQREYLVGFIAQSATLFHKTQILHRSDIQAPFSSLPRLR
jgi:hypothetical protein